MDSLLTIQIFLLGQRVCSVWLLESIQEPWSLQDAGSPWAQVPYQLLQNIARHSGLGDAAWASDTVPVSIFVFCDDVAQIVFCYDVAGLHVNRQALHIHRVGPRALARAHREFLQVKE